MTDDISREAGALVCAGCGQVIGEWEIWSGENVAGVFRAWHQECAGLLGRSA